MLNVAIDITSAMAKVVAAQGKDFNARLVEQFHAMWGRHRIEDSCLPSESVLFYQATASSLGWLQAQSESTKLPPFYFKLLTASRSSDNIDVDAELQGIKLRRRTAVAAALKTWLNVVLPSAIDTEPLDLGEIQRRALQASGVRWSTFAALKHYAMLRYKDLPIPTAIFPPLGRRTSAGLELLIGLKLGESEHDYEIGRQIHVALAKLSGATVFDINSGLYNFGGGV